jgi:hypothetical protein
MLLGLSNQRPVWIAARFMETIGDYIISVEVLEGMICFEGPELYGINK